MSLKNEVERQFHIPVRLRLGGPGVLDVFVDGEQIYSKKQTGHLPAPGELINLIRAKLSHE